MKQLNKPLLKSNRNMTRIHIIAAFDVESRWSDQPKWIPYCGKEVTSYPVVPIEFLIEKYNVPICKTCQRLYNLKNSPAC